MTRKKTASKKIEAWACGICNSTFTAKHRAGKIMADQCCTCSVEGCGRLTGRYIGGRGECEFHLAERDFNRASEVLSGNKDWLERARERLRWASQPSSTGSGEKP